jgi:hypothetical protein
MLLVLLLGLPLWMLLGLLGMLLGLMGLLLVMPLGLPLMPLWMLRLINY